jgi:hypothetical protein
LRDRWTSSEGIGTAGDLIAALNDFVPGAAAYRFGGVTPGASFTHPRQITGMSLQDGALYLHTGPDAAETDAVPNYRVVYVKDDQHPGADTADEAVAAMADDLRRLHAEVVAVGDTVRNDTDRRWEIQVVTRPLPMPAGQVHELTLPVHSWVIGGPIDTSDQRTAECYCCGKLAEELVMLVIRCNQGHPFPTTHRFQVDIRHYAKRVGVTVDQARADRDAKVESARRRVMDGVTVRRETGRARGWVLYDADGAPVIDVLFPTHSSGVRARDILTTGAERGFVHELDVEAAVADCQGVRVGDIVHAPRRELAGHGAAIDESADRDESHSTVNLYETTADGRDVVIIERSGEAWQLGPITPDETGEFIRDARAWVTRGGHWPGQASGGQGIEGRVRVGNPDIPTGLTLVARFHDGEVTVLVPPATLGVAAVYLNITTAADGGPGPEGDFS